MCGRFTLTKPGEAVAAHFRLETAPVLRARFNIAPTQPVLAVRTRPEAGGEPNGREAALFRWGLIPVWTRQAANFAALLINARAEGLASKPAFREAWRSRRCLVPADSFYEWAKDEQGRRRCWQIRRRDQEIFALAGLWEPWPAALAPAAKSPHASCTLITTTPNTLVAPVHNRMPVVIEPEAYARWLDDSSKTAAALESLLRPWPEDDWERVPVDAPLPKEN